MRILYKHGGHRRLFTDRIFLRDALVSTGIFIVGVTINFYAGLYATAKASNYVEDIVLSNIPVMNVDAHFVIGTFVIVALVASLLIARPQWLPFTAAALGLFYTIRAIFISLTHLGPFPDRIHLDWGTIVSKFIGGNDLFFSGHTGAPFLLALIFWSIPPLRYTFLAWTAFFAAIVLLGHFHYSIDVLAAFFITYTIFHISEIVFRRYRAHFFADY